jgi:hypothetical protein
LKLVILFCALIAPIAVLAQEARAPTYPGCVVMDVISKEVCPVHHGRITHYLVFSYEMDGFTTQDFTQKEWPAESARLLKLTKLTLEINQAKAHLEAMKAAAAEAKANDAAQGSNETPK